MTVPPRSTLFPYTPLFRSYGATEAPAAIINLTNRVGSVGRMPMRRLTPVKLVRYDVDTDTHVRGPDGLCVECGRSEKHTSELQSLRHLVCRLLLEKKNPALAVPASLHASLMARLDRLGPAKEVAQSGAALGREFSHEHLDAVRRQPETSRPTELGH